MDHIGRGEFPDDLDTERHLRPPEPGTPESSGPPGPQKRWRWLAWVVLVLAVAGMVAGAVIGQGLFIAGCLVLASLAIGYLLEPR